MSRSTKIKYLLNKAIISIERVNCFANKTDLLTVYMKFIFEYFPDNLEVI